MKAVASLSSVDKPRLKIGDNEFKSGILFIGDYRDPIIRDVVDIAVEKGFTPIIYDLMGLWRPSDFKTGFGNPVIGIDLLPNPFEPPSHIPLPLYTEVLETAVDASLSILGYRGMEWRLVFKDFINIVYEREGGLDIHRALSSLEVFRNESTGLEKQAYTMLLGILRNLFPEKQRHLFSTDSTIDYSILENSPMIIDYSMIDQFSLRVFTYLITVLPSLLYKREEGTLHLLFEYSHYVDKGLVNLLLQCDNLAVYNNYLMIHSRNLVQIHPRVSTVFISNKYLGNVYRRIQPPAGVFPPPDSTHHFISQGIIIPVKSSRDLGSPTQLYRTSPAEAGAESKILEEIIRPILEKVRDHGPLGIEGIYLYFQGFPRRDVYSTVEWLWRMGYLRKAVEGRREAFRITVKGLMYLRDRGENNES